MSDKEDTPTKETPDEDYAPPGVPRHETPFQVEDFHGTVSLQNFMMGPKGSYWAVTGTVSILPAADVVGWKPDDRDPKWVARVVSPEDPSRSCTILGCQVRAVFSHSPGEVPTNPEVLVL